MAIKVTVKLDSKIFKKNALRGGLSSAVGRSALKFKELTRTRMTTSTPSGRVYPLSPRGLGFRRSIRRSDRGQRPAVDTTTLINAIRRTKDNELQYTVDIAPNVNRRNGQRANVYADILQNDMARLIMTEGDARIAEIDLKHEVDKAVKKLI